MMHNIDGFSSSSDAGACFRCIYAGKMGYASTELFTEEEAMRIVVAAMDHAENIEIEDEVFIHEAGDTYVKVEPQRTKEPTSEEMIKAILDLEAKIYAGDSRVADGSQAMAAFGKETVALCNSKGLDLSYSYDYSQIGAVAILGEDGAMYNAFKVDTGDFAEFDMIIGMDDQNISGLKRLAETDEELAKIFKMTDFSEKCPSPLSHGRAKN